MKINELTTDNLKSKIQELINKSELGKRVKQNDGEYKFVHNGMYNPYFLENIHLVIYFGKSEKELIEFIDNQDDQELFNLYQAFTKLNSLSLVYGNDAPPKVKENIFEFVLKKYSKNDIDQPILSIKGFDIANFDKVKLEAENKALKQQVESLVKNGK